MAGWVYRENRVPHYQRLYQRHDRVRQWWRSPRSPYLLYPYYVLLWGCFSATTYAAGRKILGYNNFFGEKS